ncbi:CPBP family intramembrane glutamic endopeptidase [Metarhizobium album]|uniref:CPBP family intramembrane glutamic endopeptidase n=1 Tax=Metarhizobium album TaxID=2182425 RepID=UPI0014026FBB|nr:CPBP family intramembrane glutamic endopeptidase [Rhizobium album]
MQEDESQTMTVPAENRNGGNVIFPVIVQNMRDGVIAVDGTGTIITMNGPARAILSLGETDFVGENFAEALLHRSDLGDVIDAMLDAIYAPNNVLTRDLVIRDETGSERHLTIRTSMMQESGSESALGVVAIISDVSEKVQALRERAEFGHLAVLFLSMLGLANILTLIVDQYLDVDVYSPAFAWAYLIIVAGPVFVTAYWLRLPAASIGLTLNNWRQAVREGVIVSILALGALVGLSYLVGDTQPVTGTVDYSSPAGLLLVILLYAPHSFLQELLARGVLQSSLARLTNDRSGIRSVLVASLIFGLFHAHFGLPAVAVTAFSGMLFGWLFLRHGNLIGATMVHVIAGTAAFALHFV